MRNARALGSYIKGGQGRKRRDMAKLVKKVFARSTGDRGADDAALLRPELPAKFLEEEEVGSDRSEDLAVGAALSAARELEKKSPELVLVLKSLRVFGHLDPAVFQELYRYKKKQGISIEEGQKRRGEFMRPQKQAFYLL